MDLVAELNDELVKTAAGWRIDARRVVHIADSERPREVDVLKVPPLPPTPPGPHVDVGALEIRPVRSDDKPDLVRGFEQLGDESRYQRFMSARNLLSEAELRYFSEVDHHDHEALIAIDLRTGKGVGVARLCAHPKMPTPPSWR